MRGFVRSTGSKYGNHKVTVMGENFDSKREAERWAFLLDAQRRGLIGELRRQVKFELLPKITRKETVRLKTKTREVEKVEQLPVNYVADFVYEKDGVTVVEDVKISEYLLPKEYILKEKMFFWKYGIHITRVYKSGQSI